MCDSNFRLSIGGEHEISEQLRVQKVGIRFLCFQTIAWIFHIDRNRDLFPNLETRVEVFGYLIEVLA
jgi:hypothetical protein